MTATIVPCVTVSTPEEYKESLGRIHHFAQRIHVDVSDGSLAPTVLIAPDKIWWPEGWQADVHVMSTQPIQLLAQLVTLKPHMITLHAETKEDILPILQQMKQVGIRVGVALMRSTVPSEVADLIGVSDHVMIFSGNLGTYGGTASLMQLEKIRLIKNINASVEIGWDGGINVENAFSLVQGGVDIFNVGGAIQKANDPKAAYDDLVKEVNRTGVM